MNCPSCGQANIEGVDECDSCQEPLTDIPALAAPKRGMERRVLDGTVADLSPKSAVVVGPARSLAEAVSVMRAAKIGCALVAEGGKLAGVISEREILMKGELSGSVAEAMRANPTVMRDDDQVAVVFNRMAMSGHLHVPVLRQDGSYAVVSARDLLRYLCK